MQIDWKPPGFQRARHVPAFPHWPEYLPAIPVAGVRAVVQKERHTLAGRTGRTAVRSTTEAAHAAVPWQGMKQLRAYGSGRHRVTKRAKTAHAGGTGPPGTLGAQGEGK